LGGAITATGSFSSGTCTVALEACSAFAAALAEAAGGTATTRVVLPVTGGAAGACAG
jgi:hypothetical protein